MIPGEWLGWLGLCRGRYVTSRRLSRYSVRALVCGLREPTAWVVVAATRRSDDNAAIRNTLKVTSSTEDMMENLLGFRIVKAGEGSWRIEILNEEGKVTGVRPILHKEIWELWVLAEAQWQALASTPLK